MGGPHELCADERAVRDRGGGAVSTPAHPLRVGLKLSRGAPIESFRRVWQVADEAGFDHCWAFDHLATRGPGDADVSVFEGWTLLAGMAVATRRVRVGLIVTAMVLRHPALLAKQAVTVDHLSGGRLEFGIGAGWVEVEHRMFGIGELDHVAGRFSEGLRVIELLWTQERSNFDGRHYRLRDAAGCPKPVQRPRPPIWIGAGGPAMLRLTARHADVWNPASGDSVEEAAALGQRLLAACREVGRDAAEIRWSTQVGFDGSDAAALLTELEQWRQAGFTEQVIQCVGDDPVRAAEVAAQHVLPRLREVS
jgi:alkanesulfonate monooxygenase SsuD/methylene tetrahydromethanopterin reductase-like flavin-dependent oxidoreductase (luciferase family)